MEMEKIIITIMSTLLTAGLGFLLKGQGSMRKESADGREKLYNKIDDIRKDYHSLDKRVSVIETHHAVNHPGQL